jgi:hypothetical protein
MFSNLACNENLPERFNISVPAHRVGIYRIAVPPYFHLPERRSGAFRLHYTTGVNVRAPVHFNASCYIR